MATWQETIRLSLLEIGVNISGEEPELKDYTLGLSIAKQMLEGWALEGLLVPGLTRLSHTVEESKRVYSIDVNGGDADFDAFPFVRIDHVSYLVSTDERRYLLRPSSDRNITPYIENDSLSSPVLFYYENSYPRATLEFDRFTSVGDQFEIVGKGYLNDGNFALGDQTDFPPGYDRAIRLCLALELAASYGVKDRDLPRTTLAFAEEAKKGLRRRNFEDFSLRRDTALTRNRINYCEPYYYQQ